MDTICDVINFQFKDGHVVFFCKYRKLADEELKTNIMSTETYRLPNGEEVEKENILYVISYTISRDEFLWSVNSVIK